MNVTLEVDLAVGKARRERLALRRHQALIECAPHALRVHVAAQVQARAHANVRVLRKRRLVVLALRRAPVPDRAEALRRRRVRGSTVLVRHACRQPPHLYKGSAR